MWHLNTGLIILAGWGVVAITLLTTYSVVMRYGFNAPDIWTYPLSAYILCFVVFAAIAHTHQDGVHVRVDYFLNVFPRPVSAVLRALGDVATLVFLGFLLWQVWRLFTESLSRGRVDETTLGWPLAVIQWVLPLGAGLILITHLLLIVRRVLEGGYSAGRPPADPGHHPNNTERRS